MNSRSLGWASKEFGREFILVEIQFSADTNEWVLREKNIIDMNSFCKLDFEQFFAVNSNGREMRDS